MKYHASFRWAFAVFGAFALCFASATPAAAQQRGGVRGTVREASSQRPVEGVQVFIPGTQMTTTTDAQGRYELSAVPAGGAQVRVRAPGYSSALATTMVVGGQSVTVDFALNTSVIALDEVVVTGTGATTERKQLGNTIATVKADVLADAPVQNFSEAIAAREAGVSILASSGAAGEGARIRIRGNASLSQGNEPVVYVDGVRVDRSTTALNPTGNSSRLDDINPEQIERVEILKGAAAATLYGSEASAGVIQIFTKRGSQGRPKFSFRMDQGMANYPKSRLENNWAWVRNAAQADTINALFGNVDKLWGGGLSKAPTDGVAQYDVFAVPSVSPAAYYGTGTNSTYSVNVSGGGSDATYNLSGRLAREDGPYDLTGLVGPFFLDQNVLPYNPKLVDYDRKYQTSATVTMFPKDRVTLNMGLMYTDVHHQTPEQANNIYGVQSALLNSRFFPANCRASVAQGLGDAYGVDPDRPGHCAGPGNEWGTQSFGTPREDAFSRLTADADHFTGNVKATYEPLQGRLRADLTVGADITDTREANLIPFGNNVDQFSARIPLGQKYFTATFHRELTLDGKLNWNEKFSSLSSQLTFGGQGFISNNHYRFGRGRDFPGPGLEVSAAGARQVVDEDFQEIVNLGLLAQEQIGYNDWAFVTVGGRWDRNSAFGENTSGALYPKVNASLVFSDMPGWSIGGISTFRVRGALGRSGLQPGAFSRVSTFAAGTSELGSGLVPSNLGNPDLKPEVTTEVELGAELGILQNRVGLDVTRWQRKTNDALYFVQFAPSGGFLNSQQTNIGKLEASGWDLKLNTTVIDRPGLSINLFANAAYLFQRVMDLQGKAPIKTGGSYARYRGFLKEGEMPGVLLGAQILQPCGSTQYSKCLTGDQVPFDAGVLAGGLPSGVPGTRAQLEAYLATIFTNVPNACAGSVPRSYLDCFFSPSGMGTMLDDNNNDGDFYNNCLAPSKDPVGQGKTKTMTRIDNNPASATFGQELTYQMCQSKPWPDWSGAFGANITLSRNFSINALFEYRAGNFYVSNLTDGFRNASPTIGRNNQRPAELEAIFNNPANSASERADALLEFVNNYQELTPFDGMNLLEKGDFIRFRELGLNYNAPASFAQKLGFSSMSFNLSGRNVLLWSGYQGIDPEMNAVSSRSGSVDANYLDSVDAWGFPLPRRLTFSVRFGF
jgi:TonB-linked SusC/RagA family outer membrane protein